MATASLPRSPLSPGNVQPQRKLRFAWLISVSLHILLVIALGLSLSPRTAPVAAEPDRPVGIVLAQRLADQQTEYFQESDSSNSSGARPATQASPLPELPESLGDLSLVNPASDLPSALPGFASSGNPGLKLAASSALRGTGSSRKFPSQDEADILANDPIRNAPPGPQGPTAVVAPFGVTAEGRDFVFLIDRSHSMGNQGLGGMNAAAGEVNRAIDRLMPHHRFQIIAYNNRIHFFQPKGLTLATDPNKILAKKFLDSLIASGGTEHDMALRAALRRKPDVLFMFTDGDQPPLGSAQLRRLVGDNVSKASIHTFLFGSGPLQDNTHFLRRLSELNRGIFTYLDVLQPRRAP